MVIFGLTVIIAKSTGSTTAVSALILTFLLPAVLFSALAGVFVDRLDRRLVLIVDEHPARARVRRRSSSSATTSGCIYLLNIFVSTITVFFAPGRGGDDPDARPAQQLLSANGIFTLTLNAAFALGFTLLGPLIVKIAGAQALIVVVAALYFVAAVFCLTLPSRAAGAARRRASRPGAAVREAEERDRLGPRSSSARGSATSAATARSAGR